MLPIPIALDLRMDPARPGLRARAGHSRRRRFRAAASVADDTCANGDAGRRARDRLVDSGAAGRHDGSRTIAAR